MRNLKSSGNLRPFKHSQSKMTQFNDRITFNGKKHVVSACQPLVPRTHNLSHRPLSCLWGSRASPAASLVGSSCTPNSTPKGEDSWPRCLSRPPGTCRCPKRPRNLQSMRHPTLSDGHQNYELNHRKSTETRVGTNISNDNFHRPGTSQ